MRIDARFAARWAFVFVAVIAPLESSAQITLSISTDKAVYMPGEPIIAHVVITNGSEEQPVPAALSPEYGALRYLIGFENGEPREFRPWARMDNARAADPGAKAVAPGSRPDFLWRRRLDLHAARLVFSARSIPGCHVGPDADTASSRRRSKPSGGKASCCSRARKLDCFSSSRAAIISRPEISLLRDFAPSNTVLAGYANYALGVMSADTVQRRSPTGRNASPTGWRPSHSFAAAWSSFPRRLFTSTSDTQSRLAGAMTRNGKIGEALKVRQDLSSFIANDVLKRDLPAAVKGFAQTVKQ